MDVSNSSAGRDTDLRWWAESGVVDLFLLSGAAPADVWRGLARLTGAPQLAPLFSLGYHQCRWNYRDEADARAVDAGFDAWDLPYDVLWLDIEHTNGKRYLTWDAAKFPDPAGLQLDLASRGERRTVVIVDPHVKRDDGFPMHATATREGYYVKAADGAADFEGWCWPGSSSYLDVLEAPIRDWWGAQFKLDAYAGSTRWLHVWCATGTTQDGGGRGACPPPVLLN